MGTDQQFQDIVTMKDKIKQHRYKSQNIKSILNKFLILKS